MARRSKYLILTTAGLMSLCQASAHAEVKNEGSPRTEEVIITAAPYAVSIDSATTSVEVVSRAALDLATPAGLGDLLNGMVGVRSTAFGPGASRPIIRGLSGPRVMILQNGVGLVDASSVSPDHAVASDPAESSRIEVLRGPSTLAYGGSGIGGVVNMIDERVPSRPAADGLEGRATGSYDTVNNGKAFSAALKAGTGPIVFAADIVRRRSGDYAVPSAPVSSRFAADQVLSPAPDSKVFNSHVELDAYGAGLSYIGAAGYIGASVKRTDTTYGVPYAQFSAPDSAAEGPVQLHLKQTRYDLRGEHQLDTALFEKVQFSVGYADYQHAEISAVDGAVGTRFLSKGAEGRIELVHREHEGHQGAIGLQLLNRDFEAMGDEAFVPSVKVQEYAAFTLQRLDRGIWGIDAGLRLDQRRLEAQLDARPTSPAAAQSRIDWAKTARSQDFTNVSASVGLFWKPAEHQFYALSLARNGRAPTEVELYADGPHGGTGTYEIGNPNFKSETVVSIEATARYTADTLRIEGHLYAARYDGFIEENPTGIVQEDLPVFQFSQTRADFHGLELEVSQDVWTDGTRTLTLEGAGDFVRGNTDAGAPARIPPYALTARIGWEAASWGTKLEARYVGKADHLAKLELPTDGYSLINVSAHWKPLKDQALKLFVDARNLTNETAREHASFLKDIAPMPGRSLRIGTAYTF
jgi:iron complex outermembrane receptor protein